MNSLKKVRWVEFSSKIDERGTLTAAESEREIPFSIKRFFYIYNISTDRGGHAHKETDQVVVAVCGSFDLLIADGLSRKIYKMNDPKKGLYIPRMLFVEIKNCSRDAVCLVISSTYYDIKKSIRSWQEYLEAVDKK